MPYRRLIKCPSCGEFIAVDIDHEITGEELRNCEECENNFLLHMEVTVKALPSPESKK